MDKGRELILKATMTLFFIVSVLIGLIVYNVYVSFYGSYFDKLKVGGIARKYMNGKYSEYDLEIKNIDYNYKTTTYTVSVYSKKSRDTYFDIFLNQDMKIEKDSYALVEDGTTTFWRLSFGYGDIVREAIEKRFKRNLAFCSAELKSDYLESDFNHVIIKKGLERDKDYDTILFGKRAGLIDICFSDSDVSERRLAELFLETKSFLDEERIPFYMLAIILQDSNHNRGPNIRILSETFKYKDIDDNILDKIKESNYKKYLK